MILRDYYINNTKNSGKINIVFLSDFHNKYYKSFNKDLIKCIEYCNPDYIVLGGDFIDFSALLSKFNIVNYKNAFSFIEELVSFHKQNCNKQNYNLKRIFFSFGNHELRLKEVRNNNKLSKIYTDFIDLIKKNDICILDNSTYELNEYYSISALSIYNGYYYNIFSKYKNFENIDSSLLCSYFGNLDDDKFNIISFHKPDYCEDLIKYGFDLVLSGHNHGGLIKFPNNKALFSPDLSMFPKFNYGLYHINKSFSIVTSGVGEHMFKIRVNNKPEICHIHIE